jgi:methionine synthase II (cobalamin-independent)
MFTPESQEVIGPAYEGQLLDELQRVLDAVPHDQLAIQWEVVYQLGVLEGEWTVYLSDPEKDIPSGLADLVDRVPESVQTGFHFCYGDSGHRHFKQPADAGTMVSVANGIMDRVKRPINWFHMPVPRDRKDQGYFAPLTTLNLPEATSLFLGLIHFTDGETGTLERIRAASEVIDAFGVATECGLGRRPPETIPEILRIHQAVADPPEV